MKILIACSKKYWDNKMSRVRFHAMEAISKNPEVEAIFTGTGFDNFISLEQSVKTHSPDCIFWYKPLEIEGYDKIDEKIPKIISYNEMYEIDKTKEEIIKSNSNIIICHLQNDMKYFKDLETDNRIFVNISHCIEKSIFLDYKFKQPKEYDLLLAGVLSKEIYPLRAKFYEILTSGIFKNYKIKILNHPGYKISNVNDQIINYAKELNKSKIVLTCSSKYNYALAKYSEVPACNSLLIADIPDERKDFFSQYIVHIDPTWSNYYIAQKIKYWLDHNDERINKAKLGMNLTLSNYTQEDYADRFVKIVKEYIEGNK